MNTQQTYPTWTPNKIAFPLTGSVAEVMADDCRRFGARVALRCGSEELSYAQLDAYSERLAAYLRSHCGLIHGDRVAVMMPNLTAYPVAILGILRAGLVVVNVNPFYTPRELQHQLQDSGAKAIVIARPFLPALHEVLADTDVETVMVAPMGSALCPEPGDADGAQVQMNAALACTEELPSTSITPTDNAFLQYTGGTTGPSKGATLSHGNILANREQILSWIAPVMENLPEGRTHLAVTALPLYHIFALTMNGIVLTSYGATNILVPNPRDLAALAKVFRDNPVTVFSGVNTLFNGLLHTPGFADADFSSMRFVVGGGASIQQHVADLWQSVTGSCIVEGYGLSETSPLVTLNSVAQKQLSGTVGFAVPSTEVLLLGSDDQVVERGERGELCVRGPQVMSGYWNRPEANAEAFTPEGYFRTGDIAIQHENGTYQIVDRKKDMILVSGFNVYPAEIEEVCAQHPQVFEAACVGVPDAKTGEAIKVFVVPRGEGLDAETLQKHCRQHLTAYKVPHHIEFIAELPKSPVGKILRRELRSTTTRAVAA
ncbi:MAG: AMP-binding protein [Sinimarinibacterium flocculans]|uniref:AMP-binding protein n=1 Tax=Sinimarinibacterium flocculans TaxID=985250 RepID=UPI003C69E6A8